MSMVDSIKLQQHRVARPFVKGAIVHMRIAAACARMLPGGNPSRDSEKGR